MEGVARLTSVAQRGAAQWLSVVPQRAEHRLSDKEYEYAVKLRLGLPVRDVPAKCACGKEIKEEPSHFQACPLTKGKATMRHDAVLRVLARVAAEAGVVFQEEPRVDDEDGEAKRPDAFLVTDAGPQLVDVAVVHPGAPTHRRQAREPLATVKKKEAEKLKKYYELAHREGARLGAAGMESYGAFGPGMMSLIQCLAGEAAEAGRANYTEFVKWAMARWRLRCSAATPGWRRRASASRSRRLGAPCGGPVCPERKWQVFV